MAVPEGIQQSFIGDPGRIVINLNCFGVIPKIVVGRVLSCSPGISNTGTNDTRDTPEPGVRPPESAQCKGCRFGLERCRAINGREYRSGLRICFGHNRDLRLFGRFHFVTPLNKETNSQEEGHRSCQESPLAEVRKMLCIHSKPPFLFCHFSLGTVNNLQSWETRDLQIARRHPWDQSPPGSNQATPA